MAKITPEIKEYLEALEVVGEQTEKNSEKFGKICNPIPKDLKEIQRAKDQFLKLLKRYESLEEKVMKLDSPILLRPEHSRLNQSYNKFVVATDMAVRSIDDQNNINEGLLKEGQKQQWEASNEIIEITDDIVKKLK